MREPPVITLDWLRARCTPKGECMVWNGWCDKDAPKAKAGGVNFPVRRSAWRLAHPVAPIKPDTFFVVSCGTAKCTHPDHIIQSSRSAALTGCTRSPLSILKMTAAKRAKSKLPQDQVLSAVILDPRPASAVAADIGLSKDMVNRIRAGKNRRDMTPSPWAGMGARG